MKKTVSINISGIIFNIDEDAYFELKKYLDTIQGYFRNQEGGDDIMSDIESRIAEMFQEQISDRQEVITQSEVANVIAVMGQPEDYMDDEMREEQHQQQHQQQRSSYRGSSTRAEQDYTTATGPKRFFRDSDNRVLGGVCSGLGYYFGVDPVIFRLLFVGIFFFAGTGVLAYIILWIITPRAVTTAEKLQMKGKPVNIDNIRQAVENDTEEIRKKIQDLGSKSGNFGGKLLDLIKTLLNFLIDVLRFAFRFVGKAVGIILLFFCSLLLVSMIATILGFTTITTSGILAITDDGMVSFPPSELSNFFMEGAALYLIEIGAFLFICIPLFGLIYAGIRLLFKAPQLHKYYTYGALGLWGVGWVCLFWGASRYGHEVSQSDRVVQEIRLPQNMSDTLYVECLTEVASDEMMDRPKYSAPFLLDMDESSFFLGNVKFDVQPTDEDSAMIKIIRKSNGPGKKAAQAIAENITYDYMVDSNQIRLSPVSRILKDDRYHYQRVKVEIYLPEGKTLFLGKNIGWIIYDIENKLHIYDRDMLNHYWLMTDEGLVCPKCPESISRVRRAEREVEEVMDAMELELEAINLELVEITEDFHMEREDIEQELKYALEDIKLQLKEETESSEAERLNLEMQRIQQEFDRNIKRAEQEMDRQLRQLQKQRKRIQRKMQDKQKDSERSRNESRNNSRPDPSPSPSLGDGEEGSEKSWTKVQFPHPFTFI